MRVDLGGLGREPAASLPTRGVFQRGSGSIYAHSDGVRNRRMAARMVRTFEPVTGDLGQLEVDGAGVAHHARVDLDQLQL